MNDVKRFGAFALVCALIASPAFGKGMAGRNAGDDSEPERGAIEAPHTMTWFCTDLTALLDVKVPVVVGAAQLVLPSPSPVANPCSATAFPIVVQAGSGWTSGTSEWFTNTVYTPAVVKALTARGFQFVSDKPMDDLRQKIVEVRFLVLTDNAARIPVAEFSFDPREHARVFHVRDFNALLGTDPITDPTLGIDLSAKAVGALPQVSFPAIGGAVLPGNYRLRVIWKLSAEHNDGLGLVEGGNFLAAGDNVMTENRFRVVP
jgi:hypothetical protein